jgi:putative heme iron utilization protein
MMEPSWAERARTLLAAGGDGVLATLDTDFRPLISPVRFVADADGTPVVVLSALDPQTLRAWQDPRASFAVGTGLLLQGDLVPVPGLQQVEAQARFLARHPQRAGELESLDFAWLRLVPSRVRWVDDRGVDRWLRPDDLRGAEPDPLAPAAAELVHQVTGSLGADVALLARAVGGHWSARSAQLVAIDRYGLDVELVEPAGRRRARIPFPEPVDSAREVHRVLATLTAASRAREGGDETRPAVPAEA